MKTPEDRSADDCGNSFKDDLLMVKKHLVGDNNMIVSYCLYVGVEDTQTGKVTHLSSYASNTTDSLVGRLEMIKSIIVDRYNQSVAEDIVEEPINTINTQQDASKPFDLNKFILNVKKNKLN